MLAPQTQKLLALTVAAVVVFGGGFTYSTFQDSEHDTVTFSAGNSATGPGEEQTNDVSVSIGNTAGNSESCAGNSNECTMSIQPVAIDIPAAAEPRYENGGVT